MSICPNCGKAAGFTEHFTERHGGRGLSYEESWGMDHEWEEWFTCNLCGAKTDQDEIARVNAPQEAEQG